MIIRNTIFLTLLLILVSSSYTSSIFTFKRNQDSLIARVKHNRVKREWNYPTSRIRETIEGAPFKEHDVLTISSSNEKTVKYELLPNSIGVSGGYFVLENRNGEGVIRQLKGIDREQYPKLTLNARALDARGNPTEPDVPLEIIIEDENDNNPIFVPASLTGNVLESETVGQTFMQLEATDADSSYNEYNKVRYRYDGNENPPTTDGSSRFTVSESGQVSVVSALNREKDKTVTFVVTAMDGLAIPGGLRRSTSATVTVNILDSNDNAPYFDPDPPAQTVGELTEPGTLLFTVYADDVDEGVNKGVYFKISGGNVGDAFSIQSEPQFETGLSAGKVVLNRSLDFENGEKSYALVITAYNKDALNNRDTLTTSATVQITVEDEDEPPVFLNEPYFASIVENIPEGVPNFFKVTARDYDFNGAQQVRYTLENPLEWFEINQNTGDISAVSALDREHVSVDQPTSQYLLKVIATDDGSDRLSSTATVTITIGDKNDNDPTPGAGWNPTICEKPSPAQRKNVTYLRVKDRDSSKFAPFTINKLEAEDWQWFALEGGQSSHYARLVIPLEPEFNAGDKNEYLLPVQLVDTAADGQAARTSTATATVTICSCNENYELLCTKSGPVAAGFSTVALIGIIVAILILLIIVLAVVAYKRRNVSELEKQALFQDEDDVRENLQPYHEEGGEEDNDGYDISALQAPLPLAAPKRQDVTPLGTAAQPQPRSRVPPDTDIGDYINDAKQQADNDPTAPPFDSILVFDYEGQGSDAGSLSSLNSGTTDASQDYDYLQDWGPRFKKLADMYGGGEED